jgi:hypothetical protein
LSTVYVIAVILCPEVNSFIPQKEAKMPVPARPPHTRAFCILTGVLAATAVAGGAQPQPQPEPPTTLVREVVYNELHDHQRHGWWRYWIQKHSQKQTLLEEQVETEDGPITRTLLLNGRALNAVQQQQENARLEELLNSSSQRADLKQAYTADEQRIGRIVALLPEAFLYQDMGEENGLRHFSFRPNPNFPPHSIEARIFHAMTGDLWIDARMKRMARLRGQLNENVDFGFGILGRLYKGGWFELSRTEVSPTDWKTERLEIHMSGRALLFKSIARETSEVRGGFTAVTPAMTLVQGMNMLEDNASAQAIAVEGKPSPTAFEANR